MQNESKTQEESNQKGVNRETKVSKPNAKKSNNTGRHGNS